MEWSCNKHLQSVDPSGVPLSAQLKSDQHGKMDVKWVCRGVVSVPKENQCSLAVSMRQLLMRHLGFPGPGLPYLLRLRPRFGLVMCCRCLPGYLSAHDTRPQIAEIFVLFQGTHAQSAN
jgi:hypothetical protein